MRAFLSRIVTTHGLFIVLAAVVLPVYWWQLSYGVDFSDEGYYATLAVSWLRSNPSDTGNLSPHQFSAALYYPLVRAFAVWQPDLNGLILFLRRAYLCGSCLTCFAGYRFFAQGTSPAVATAASLCLLVFSPLSLPAVSYNTLALFGLGAGLLTLARSILDRETAGRGGWFALGLSSLLMAIGGCAYPSVALLVPLALSALIWLFPTQRRILLVVLCGWLGITVLLLAGITLHLGGVTRMAEVIDFSRSLYAGSMGEKLEAAGVALYGKGQLLIPCALTFLMGVLRRMIASAAFRPLFLIGCVAVAGWWLTCNRPTGLFTKGHDVVFLFCSGFVPLLPLPKRSLPPVDRLLTVLFLVGIVGGVLVASSAVAGLINFPVLGILAVSSGVAISAREIGHSETLAVASFGVVAAIAWGTLT